MGSSASGGKSESESKTKTNQDVWRPQGQALNTMYDQMGDLWGQSGGLGPILQNLAGGLGGYNQNLMQGGMGGYNNMLGGGSFGDTTDVRSALMDSMQQTGQGHTNVGDMYRSIVGGEGNTYIDPMVDAMKGSSMDNLSRMHSQGGLDATVAGQGGSSRHAMQNAMQSSQMNNDMLDREMGMRGTAYDKDLNWKMDIAKQADMGIANTQNNYMRMMGGADTNVGSGMGYGGGLQNLGMGSMAPYMQAYNAPWDMAGQYSNILGSPTVLGSGSGSSNSKAVQGGASSGGGK